MVMERIERLERVYTNTNEKNRYIAANNLSESELSKGKARKTFSTAETEALNSSTTCQHSNDAVGCALHNSHQYMI